MRRGLVLLAFGVLAAALGLASARASAAGTPTTTTGTTTTGTTTTTPSYAPLANSLLPAGCVGAGAAAIVPPSHAPVALGTPASNLGPSGYPTSASVVAFGSAAVSGSTCGSAQVTLSAVSLFGGAVTAASVTATNGRGTASGLEIDGAAVSAAAGQPVPVEGWGELVLGAAVGRLIAPLEIRLLQAHDGLLPGTAVVVAFAAAPRPAVTPAAKGQATSPTPSSKPQTPAKGGSTETQPLQQSQKPAPAFPAAAFPFLLRGGLTASGRHNPVVSAAAQYLGVPYEWGGASPKTGFDCSGLVSYVFAQLGVSLPHYAAAQYHSPDGIWVAPNRLQPGDLVFFTGSDGTRQAPGHVGIYVGDGYLIDAPHTGSFVRIDSLDGGWYADKYVGARRIVAQLDARHVLDVSKRDAPTSILLRMFPQQLALGTAGESTAQLAAVAYRSASSDNRLRLGAPLGGLLILLLAGAVAFHRRRRSLARPSEMPPA